MMSVNTKSVRFDGWGYSISYACFKLKFTLNTHKKEREQPTYTLIIAQVKIKTML